MGALFTVPPGLAVLRGQRVEGRCSAHGCHVGVDEAAGVRREAGADVVGQGDGSVAEEVAWRDPGREGALVGWSGRLLGRAAGRQSPAC